MQTPAGVSAPSDGVVSRVLDSLSGQSWPRLLEHSVVAVALLLAAKRIFVDNGGLVANLQRWTIRFASSMPGLAAIVDREQQKIVEQIQQHVTEAAGEVDENKFAEIPVEGLSSDAVLALLREWRAKEHDFNDGRVFGGIYHWDNEHEHFVTEACAIYQHSNALYPSAFPGLRKFEAEIVRMSVNLLHGDQRACGVLTTGGTESILMAMKTCRDRARELYPSIVRPQIIIPSSAHAAFLKGAHYFDIEIVTVPVDDSFQVDVNALRRAITKNTIMVVASAPTFPHGIVDPVDRISEALKDYPKVWLHVDCCLGGFLLPWLEKTGHFNKPFDFRVPRVMSISADLHKYGYGPKGASVILYRSEDLRRYQYFTCTEWSGGLYCSPAMSGSKGGSSIAGAWATMVKLGQNGFKELANQYWDVHTRLCDGIEKIPGLYLMIRSDACTISFNSKEVDILKVADAMGKRRWALNRLHKPICIMTQVGVRNNFDVDVFLKDLAECVEQVRHNPSQFEGGMAPIYYTAATIGNREMVGGLLSSYMDVLYNV